MSKEEITVFLSEWDTFSGIHIIQSTTSDYDIDIEKLSFKILNTFEHKYEIGEENDNNILFQLPLLKEDLTARIFIGRIKSNQRDDVKSYIIAVLFPFYFERNLIPDFDDNILNLSEIYEQDDLSRLNDEIDKIIQKYKQKQEIQFYKIKLDESYTEKKALIDFKKGLEFFSNGDYQNSYINLKKPFIKFKKTNNLKFLVKISYFLGISLSKLYKYKASLEYFTYLNEISKNIGNSKYYVDSIYMSAFCSYKLGDYDYAKKVLENAEKNVSDMNDSFKFHYLYGRVLGELNEIDSALKHFRKTKEIIEKRDNELPTQESMASFQIEFANLYFRYATRMLITYSENDNFKKYLNYSTLHYQHSVDILKDLGDYQSLIIILKELGQIYTILGNFREANDYYRKAISFTELNNDMLTKMEIFDLMLLNLEYSKKFDEIIYETDKILSELKPYAYIDLYTIANYHYRLGNAFLEVNNEKNALSEFLISKNIFDKLKKPTKESLNLLRIMYGIYLNKNQRKYIDYYQEKIEQYEIKLNQHHNSLKKLNAISILKKVWIFSNDNIELYSYSSEENMNKGLFTGFLTGLLNFSKEFSSMKLNSIKIGSDKYYVYRKKNSPIYVVGKARYTHEEFKILKILKKIFELFISHYKIELENQIKGPENFKEFHSVLNEI